jgi:hypothetical protein
MGPHSCATVAIKGESTEDNPTGVVIINESDFDADTMILCDIPETPVVEIPVDPVVAEVSTAPKVVAPWTAT